MSGLINNRISSYINIVHGARFTAAVCRRSLRKQGVRQQRHDLHAHTIDGEANTQNKTDETHAKSAT